MTDERVQTPERSKSRGATAVEYALLVAFIAGVIIAAVVTLSDKTEGMFQKTDNEMVNAGL
jgi:Flp pilus assembly pilin Flp